MQVGNDGGFKQGGGSSMGWSDSSFFLEAKQAIVRCKAWGWGKSMDQGLRLGFRLMQLDGE